MDKRIVSKEKAHFNLALEVAKYCFAPVPQKNNTDEVYQTRRDFADSKMLKMLCDCTDNLSFETLKEAILLYNQPDKTEFKAFVKKHYNHNSILIKVSKLDALKNYARKSQINKSI